MFKHQDMCRYRGLKPRLAAKPTKLKISLGQTSSNPYGNLRLHNKY